MKRLFVSAAKVALLASAVAALAACQTTGGKSNLFSGLNAGPSSRSSPVGDIGSAVGDIGKSVAKGWDSCKDLKPYELTLENEYYLGRSAAANVLNKYGVANVLPPDHALVAYVRRVGLAVAQTSGDHLGDAKLRAFSPAGITEADRAWPMHGYHFIVVKEKKPNAHGMPGGFVVVTTGLLEKVQNEEDLAGVLGHEIAHVHRGHGVTLVKRAMCAEVEGVSGAVTGTLRGLGGAIGNAAKQAKASGLPLTSQLNPEELSKVFDGALSVMQDAMSNGYGQEFEFEADGVATELIAWTGYGPKGLKDVLGRLPLPVKGGTFDLTSTHPDPRQRIQKVGEVIAKEKLKEVSDSEAERLPRFKEAFSKLATVRNEPPAADTGSGGD